jgi:ABC-type sulfate transport system permease component
MKLVNFVLGAWTIFIFIFFYLPIAILVAFSFNTSRLNIIWEGFTLEWYAAIWRDAVLVQSLNNSVIVAVVATLLSVGLGTGGAWLLYRYRFPAVRLVQTLVFIPMIIPEVIMGVSLLILFVTIHLELGFLTIIISHVTFCFPFVMAAVQARLTGLDPSLEEAAMDLGATPAVAFRRVLVLSHAGDHLRGADVVHPVARRADRHLLHRQRRHAYAAAGDLRARQEGPRSDAQRDLDRVHHLHRRTGGGDGGSQATQPLITNQEEATP